ncbi:MAG: ECF transporter S component [Clostridium sp.]|uniref:ECF transporter S component n=1 Tax=Clostridium sp. TaxID=1506 RepID=UPI002FC8689B
MRSNTKILVQTALGVALVTLCTMVIKIPIPSTQGYVNVGDAMIFALAISLGKKRAALAGGVGACIADILLGAAIYAPATLIIKAVEGYVCGIIYENIKEKSTLTGTIVSCLIGGLVMVVGYFGYEAILYGYIPAAAAIIPNLIQGGASLIIAVPLSKLLTKTVQKLEISSAA